MEAPQARSEQIRTVEDAARASVNEAAQFKALASHYTMEYSVTKQRVINS